MLGVLRLAGHALGGFWTCCEVLPAPPAAREGSLPVTAARTPLGHQLRLQLSRIAAHVMVAVVALIVGVKELVVASQ